VLFSFLPISALVCGLSSAFVPQTRVAFSSHLGATAAETDRYGNNILVKEVLAKVEREGLLTKVAQSGLLSKAQKAGISLSKLEPLLKLASENPDILVLVEASGPELLPLLPKIVEVAPSALPLLGAAISIPAPAIAAAGIGALGAAGLAVATIPDDTVANVAIQTLAVGLAVPLAGASFAGSAIIGKLTK